MEYPVLAVYADNSIEVEYIAPSMERYGAQILQSIGQWFMEVYVYNMPVKCEAIILPKEFTFNWVQWFENAARGYSDVYSTHSGESLGAIFDRFLIEVDPEVVDPLLCKMNYINLGLGDI